MSTDKQEDSIEGQRIEIEKYAAALGYKIIRWYSDEGISGTKSEERKGFQQLIADAGRKEFQVILCWDQDRFGRFDSIDSGYWIYPLRQNGIRLVTVSHGEIDWNTFQGRMIFNIQQEGKHQFVLDVRRNTKRALQKLKSEGKWVGCIPTGYTTEGEKYDRRLVLGNDEDIALVKRIFDLRAKAGAGVTWIASQLNSEGVPSRLGKKWTPPAISAILKNPTYVGDRIATDGTMQRDVLPAIIDRDTWNAVQVMPKKKRRANGNNVHALSGLLVCGLCGQPMYAKTSKNWEGYLCATYTHTRKCGHCAVRRDPILKVMAAKLREHVLMQSREELEAVIQKGLDRRRTPSVDTKATKKKLAALDYKIERAVERVLDVPASVLPVAQKQLLELKQRRDQLAATVDLQPARRLPSAKEIADKIWELDRHLTEASPGTLRHVLAQWIDHIRLDFRELPKTDSMRRFEFSGGAIHLMSQTKSTARSF